MSARMRPLRPLHALTALVLLLVVFAAPGVALAAARASTPPAGGDIDVQAWAESGSLVIVTSLQVPESVKLPTTVRIPVPAGAAIQWAGEVLGGDLSADPAREYTIVDSPAGGRFAEFTLEQTRSAQVDSSMDAVKTDGAATSGGFEWVQAADAPSTTFSVRFPDGATGVRMSPQPSGVPDMNAAGESMYTSEPAQLKPGEKVAVSFSYSIGAKSAAGAAGRSGGVDALVIVLAVALVIAVAVLVGLVGRQARSRASAAQRPRADMRSDDGTVSSAGVSTDEDWGFDDLD